MCQTCEGKGVIHTIASSMITFQQCTDCSEEERESRRARFEELYAGVAKMTEAINDNAS